MKFIAVLYIFLASSCANGKEIIYTGSTPAGPLVRVFLGIPLSDSIDFIRWRLTLDNNKYQLHGNYGIGKPNTNGFYDGGKHIELSGELSNERFYFVLHNKDRSLRLARLNDDLLHLTNDNNEPLAGTAGWSYTLNNTDPAVTDMVFLKGSAAIPRDSAIYEGRTPCGVPRVTEPGQECYKLKWLLTLYTEPTNNYQGTYKLIGTAWRNEKGKTGNWKLVAGKEGRVIYRLDDSNGDPFIYLLKPAENILLFTDLTGKLLVGNEDFSYTLNRKQL